MNIVGMRVMHKKERWIGTIQKIQDGYVYILVHGNMFRFEYPGAFASFLEIEDIQIQNILEEKGYSFGFENFKNIYKHSITNEIEYLKSTGGKKYKAVDGVRLNTKNDEYLYIFDTDTDYHFPDGTPIKIWLLEKIIVAYVVYCEDFSMMIRTIENMGEEVSSIEFTAEQWLLLEMLMERLNEMNPTDNSIGM